MTMDSLIPHVIQASSFMGSLTLLHRWCGDTTSFDMVKNEQRDVLTDHLSSMDSTESIKFSDKLETEGSILFLDTLISR